MLLKSCPIRCRGLFAALVVAICIPPARPLAQSAETIKAFEKGPHTGPVEEALVGLRADITFRDGTHQIRHCNGLMLRCDGFVLAPTSFFFSGNPKNPTVNHVITAFLYPGTDQEKRVPGRLPTVFGQSPLNKSERLKLGYAVLKLDEVHVPALRTLLPAALNPGDPAQIVWSAWDAAHNRFLPAQRRAVQLGENLMDKKKLAMGRAVFLDTAAEVPAGATLVGPEEKGIGFTAEASSSAQKEFLTFAVLGYATNCISPQTSADAQFPQVLLDREQRRLKLETEVQGHGGFGKQLPPKITSVGEATESAVGTRKPEQGMVGSAPDMVYVPGGPVRMPPGVLQFQSDMQGQSTACVAPFLIDKYEVTNRQYYAFWKSLPETVRQDKDKRFFTTRSPGRMPIRRFPPIWQTYPCSACGQRARSPTPPGPASDCRRPTSGAWRRSARRVKLRSRSGSRTTSPTAGGLRT